MRVLCAWCLKDGKPEADALIGQREPLDDTQATHGICPDHRREVEDQVTRLREEAEQQRAAAEQLRRSVDP